MPPDTVQPLLAWAVERLRLAGCETPALDVRLLLQEAAGLSREDILLDPSRTLEKVQSDRFRALLARRQNREPVSRILGYREFYGRSFRLTPDVLDPRPDTETLVDACLALMPPEARLLDLGTGSGAIILTLLAEREDAIGVAVDLSPKALAVAEDNARQMGLQGRVTFLQGSWFEAGAGAFDIIVSNPPYIPTGDIAGLSPDVRNFDPVLALAGGSDGLEAYRIIAEGAALRLRPHGRVVVEIGMGQAEEVETIFLGQGFTVTGRHGDLGGHMRCLAFASDDGTAYIERGSKKPIGNSRPVG